TNQIAMHRRKKRDEPFAIHTRLEREVNTHHEHRENLDEYRDKSKHFRENFSRARGHLIVNSVQEFVFAGTPHLAHCRESRHENVDAPFPFGDHRRQNGDQRSRLLDNRRNEQREQSNDRYESSDNREEKCETVRKVGALDENVADSAEVQRDDDCQEQEKKRAGCETHRPQCKDSENYRCESWGQPELLTPSHITQAVVFSS